MTELGTTPRRTLRVYFIKPSQYAPDGSVWAYRWGIIPNNTLTVLAGLNAAYAEARPAVQIETVLWDELVDGVIGPSVMRRIAARAVADGVDVLIGLAGVQTGQYCRGRDLALQFRELGFPVLIGGFHVSADEPSRAFLESMGITVVIGEAEATWPGILDDYLAGRLRSRYTVESGLRARTGTGAIQVPPIADAPLPAIDDRYRRRFFNPSMSTVDSSRGCPFACSYCAVKNVMGRTMRARDPGALLEWMRRAYDHHGVRSLFIVDDDFYRSPAWPAVLEGMAALRREGRGVSFMMQVDVDATPDPGELELSGRTQQRRRDFVAAAAAAGCYAVFIGFESFDPGNLAGTAKIQNQARQDRRAGRCDAAVAARVKEKYRAAVAAWHGAGVAVHAGYMIGLPHDRRGCGRHAARALADIGVDIVSFFPYTPLPGTEDYDAALRTGALVERDFNRWDCLHVVNAHPTLSRAEVYREYRAAHRAFYSWRRLAWSIATFHRVQGLSHDARYGALIQHLYYTYAYRRGWHPMLGGIWRQRDVTVRREVISDTEAAAHYRPSLRRRPGSGSGIGAMPVTDRAPSERSLSG